MAACDPSKTFPHLLSQHLHGLTELVEIVTLRLLELEERLKNFEVENSPKDESPQEAAQKLLAESEARVRNLQDLLEIAQATQPSLNVCAQELSNQETFDEFQSEPVQEIVRAETESESGQLIESLSQEQGISNDNDFEDTEYIDNNEIPLLTA